MLRPITETWAILSTQGKVRYCVLFAICGVAIALSISEAVGGSAVIGVACLLVSIGALALAYHGPWRYLVVQGHRNGATKG